MEDQQNSERSDHLDEIGSDPAMELVKSMPLYSPLRVPWCADPSLESFHLPFDFDTYIGSDPAMELAKSMPLYSPLRVPWCTDSSLESFNLPFDLDTYSSISTTVTSSPPDFDGVFSDGLHGINTTSSMSVSYYRTGSYGSKMVITLEVIRQQFGKPFRDAAQSFGVARSTLKRLCRRYGIHQWPCPERVKKKCSFNPNLVTGSVEYVEGAIGPTSLSTHSIPSVVERSQRISPSCKHCEHLEEKNISPAFETTSSDGQADIGNQFLGSSLSSHKGVLQEQNEFLPGSNKSKMVYGSEEDNINVCHGNDPAGNLCGSSNHIDSLEARGSPKLTQLADLTTTAYSSFCSLGFTMPQTELPCSDRALKQPMATLPPVVPHVTTMKNAGIVTTLQKEPDNLMTAPCWGSTNELEVLPPNILLPCLTESTAHDNLAQPRSLTHHEAESNGGELTQLTTYGGNIVNANKSCIFIHHPEKKNTIETQKRKCRTDWGEDLPIEVTEFHNGKKLCSIQYGGMEQLDASNQQSMDPINSGSNGGSGEQCDNVVTNYMMGPGKVSKPKHVASSKVVAPMQHAPSITTPPIQSAPPTSSHSIQSAPSANASQTQISQSINTPHTHSNGVGSNSIKVRGQTRGTSISRLIANNGGNKLPVYVPRQANAPVGLYATQFANELGLQIRKAALLYGINKWDDLDESQTTPIIQFVRKKFDIKNYDVDEFVRKAINKKCKTLYKNWRNKMKTYYLKVVATGVDPYSKPYEGVDQENWEYMINHVWLDKDHQELAEKYKKNRGMLQRNHTMGSKSFQATAYMKETFEKKRKEALKLGPIPTTQEEQAIEVLGKRSRYIKGFEVGSKPSSSKSTVTSHAPNDEVQILEEQLESLKNLTDNQQQQIESQNVIAQEQSRLIELQNKRIEEIEKFMRMHKA